VRGKFLVVDQPKEEYSLASSTSPHFNYSERILIEIEIAPLEEEESDFETLSSVEEVIAGVKNEAASLVGYSVTPVPTGKRSGGEIIQLIGQVVQSVNENKELLALLGTLASILHLLKKWRRVKKMEIIWENKKLIIEDADSATVESIIKRVEVLASGEATTTKPVSKLKVNAKVSKHDVISE